MKKGVLAFCLSASLLATALAGCAASPQEAEEQSPQSSQPQSTSSAEVTPSADSGIAIDDMFTDRDWETQYDQTASGRISLNGDSAASDAEGVRIEGSTVTITTEGTYILSGTLEEGMVIVEADKSDKVQLVLDGASITCETSAALYIRQADKVFITLAEGSQNTLATTGEFVDIDDNNIDGAIFSKDDLTLNGTGALTIQSATGHGVVSKDDLVFTGGTYEITAAKQGISGKDSVRIGEGTFTISSQKDGIHAENEEDTSLGFLYIASGTFAITAQTDGLDASGVLQIDGGTFQLSTGGGSQNASTQQDGSENQGWGRWEAGAEGQESADEGSTSSAKGIKAAGNLVLNQGTFAIDSSDDALHSDGNLTIAGGTYEISSGDDGIHADGQVQISEGTLAISKSYEGIEGQSVEISGGQIQITSTDDGINAAGGNDQSSLNGRPGMDAFSGSGDSFILISGGEVQIDASGDGIDSNGGLYVSGGETYVSGAANGGNGALDYAGEAQITGGIVVAAGMSTMAQNFGSSSTQGTMLVEVQSQTAGTQVELRDSQGNVLVSFAPGKAYDSVVISCPQIVEGETYTVVAGSSETQVTMDTLVYGQGHGMGGGRGR